MLNEFLNLNETLAIVKNPIESKIAELNFSPLELTLVVLKSNCYKKTKRFCTFNLTYLCGMEKKYLNSQRKWSSIVTWKE